MGKGNPIFKKQKHYRQLFEKFLDEGRFETICEALFKKAEEGDVQALKLVFEYGLGKPKQQVEVSQPEDKAQRILDNLAVLNGRPSGD